MKTAAKDWMLARMKEGTFSFSELHGGCSAALGYDETHYRLADRLIQQQRKAGKIALNAQRRWEYKS